MIEKIILFGSNGMLGNYVKRFFKNNYKDIELIETTIRINKDNLIIIEDYLLGLGLNSKSCIINCAGAIPQRNPGDFWIINTVFPHLLSSICNNHGAKMIHPTTDCVFNGTRGNYMETDNHDETNEYGRSKSLGEPSNCTVIRTSIIGREINNKKSFMEWICQNDANINGWTNHYWNGVTCLQWCKIVAQIINENLFWQGVRHIFSPKAYSKYELACIIKDSFKLSGTIIDVETSSPVDKTLNTLYRENEMFLIPDLKDQINDLVLFSS